VSVTDLILNAVALEFVLCVDEIIFEALAPQRLKSMIENFSPMPIPQVSEIQGLDRKSVGLFSGLIFCIFMLWGFWVVPFEYRLKIADDALCAGEINFVYTLGGSGVPAWSKTNPYLDGKGNSGSAKSFGTGDWSQTGSTLYKQDKKSLNFVEAVVDSLIDGYANIKYVGNDTCGASIYYTKINQTSATPYCEDNMVCVATFCEAQYFVGIVDIHGVELGAYSDDDIRCCLAQQMKTPNIKGGRLSLNGFEDETAATATDLLNAACTDQLGPQIPYVEDQDKLYVTFYNLIAGSFSDVFGGTCGICPAHTPYCDPVLNECRNITCSDVSQYCLEDSTAGLRARQFCPITCGCASPTNQLVLSGPSFGCPANCGDYLYYDAEVKELTCEDKPYNASEFSDYVGEVTRVSNVWPGFWRDQWLTTVGPFIQTYGCQALYEIFWNPSLPQDLCRFGGSMWPIKPITYLCPITCGCASEMRWGCPSSCAVNVTST
jgi:hypothetical protein